MPRSTVPSRLQVDILLESLEERPWLGTGHARTLHARDRIRAAWQEVATLLNSDENGCIKSWQQWSKYWKDKKSAVRKKASQIKLARQQTGGDAFEEGLVLSAVEERIVALTDGEGKVQTEHPTPPKAVVQPGPSSYWDSTSKEEQPTIEIKLEPTSPPTVPHRSNTPINTSSPHRRRLIMVRRRLNQRMPPTQRHSQLASLIKRFIAMEEKRLDNERLVIENQRRMLEIFQSMSEAWTTQAQAMRDLVRQGSRD